MSGETEREPSGWTVDTAKTVLTEKIESDRRLLRVVGMLTVPLLGMAWYEIQRRLANLNHEHERIEKNQSESVSHDTYVANERRRDDEREKLDTWRKEVDEDRTRAISRDAVEKTLRGERKTNVGLIIGIASIFLAVVVFAANYLTRQEPAPIIVRTPTVTTTR